MRQLIVVRNFRKLVIKNSIFERNAEKINLQLCQSHFLIGEAKNEDIVKAMSRLFNEAYRKMAKKECRFIFVALLSETIKQFRNGLPAFRSNVVAMLHNQGFTQHNHCNRG